MTLLLGLLIATTINAQEKYAIVVCGDVPDADPTGSWVLANPQDTEQEWDEFWNDTYLMWEMLIEKGYDNDNIFVLFNDIPQDWSDPDLEYNISNRYNPREQYYEIIGDGHITDYAATESNLNMVLDGMVTGNEQGIKQLTENDFLFVWAFGHGGQTTPGHSSLSLQSGVITDEEFYSKIQAINCDKKVLLFLQCHSGPFSNIFENETDVYALSATSETRIAHAVDKIYYEGIADPGDPPGTEHQAYEEDIWEAPNGEYNEHTHSEFNLHIWNSIMNETPAESNEYEITGYPNALLENADLNNDYLTSMYEAKEWMWDYNSAFSINAILGYEDPQLNDAGNLGNITSVKYPTIIHSNIGASKTENGIIGIPVNVHILEGTTLTLTVADVYLDCEGDLYIDEGATLIIDDNVTFRSVNGLRKIIIDGNIQIANNVSFIAEDGNQLQIKINNTTIDVEFNTTQFTGAGLMAYNNSTTITNSVFTDAGLYGFNGDFGISNCNFDNSFINIQNATSNEKYVNITGQCYLTAYNTGNAIKIENYPNFNISDNTISNCYSGIYILNSGYGKGNNLISENTISNNSSTGITLYNSTTEVKDNTINLNYIGIKLYNNSKTTINGDDNIITQHITDNNLYQMYISNGSFPYVLRYNKISDDDYAACWIRYTGEGEGLDARYNNWGGSYYPEENLCPTGAYQIEPIWNPGDTEGGFEAEAMFNNATLLVEQQDYTGAKAGYQQVITQYPATKFAQASLKELVHLEKLEGNDYSSLKSYYETEPAIQNNPELIKLADFLANRCNLKLENWPDAISWFEDVIQNPEAVEDSIFAIIDLGYTYWLMENGGMKSSNYVGAMPQYKFATVQAFEENRDWLLSLLPGDDLNLTESMKRKVEALNSGKLLQNIPNPFSGKTKIFYKLEKEVFVTIHVYDYTGKLIKTYNEGTKPEGAHNVEFNSKGLPTGMYFYSIDVNGVRSDSKKMIVE